MPTRSATVLSKQLFLNRPTRLILQRLRAQPPDGTLSAIAESVIASKRIMPLTQEWFGIRGRLLTASRMAACLGQNRHCTPGKLFLQLTHQAPPFTGNAATQWGQSYEAEAAAVYSALTGLDLVEETIGFMTHDYEKKGDEGRKRYGATPDFLTKTGIVVEIKCPYKRKITHHVPAHYMAQVQMQLELCNAPVAHFVQYLPPLWNADGVMDIYSVRRDPTWWARSVPEFDDFWDTVIKWYRDRSRPLGERTALDEVPVVEAKCRGLSEAFAFVKK
jgi:putative phage-type endonuclease